MEMIEKLEALEDLTDALDFDYSTNEVHINDFASFQRNLMEPFLDPDRSVFYRGERKSCLDRPLLPTMFRDRDRLVGEDRLSVEINMDFLLRFYKSPVEYFKLFCSAFGKAHKYCMYDLCAFSQHYLQCSPFIDFTKSLYVALSFGLKGKHAFEEDAVVYAVEVTDPENYTDDRVTAECWLNEYHVHVYRGKNRDKSPSMALQTSPEAKIIDIATNDRMKFQQGVFLLLTNFDFANQLYLTKNVRDSVKITKYVLNKEICPELTDLVAMEAPWYTFENLLDVEAGIRTAIYCGSIRGRSEV